MRDPFNYLQQQINRMFDDTFAISRGTRPTESFSTLAPPVEITESENEVKITAELPGIESKDLDVNLSEESLSIRGEKRHESHGEEKGGQWTEREYGIFERVIPLPTDVKPEEAKAVFKNGVLEITLPKREGARPRSHKIQIES
jgi:HSP20 family protein